MKTNWRKIRWNITTLVAVVLVACVSCAEEKVKEITVEVEQLVLNILNMSLDVDGTQTLNCTILPAEAAKSKLTWESSNEAVATVDQNGKITAVSFGTATITVKSSNGISATCAVTVEDQSSTVVDVTGITLDKTTLSLVTGSSAPLYATVKPANATDKTVVWESGNTQVATVDGQGRVTAVAVGVARVTAKAATFTASCEVTVTPEGVPATEIKLDKKELSVFEGDDMPDGDLAVMMLMPENTTDVITWFSLNAQIATVEGTNKGGKVKAVGLGTTGIVVKAGDATDTCRVTVLPVSDIEIVESITLDKTIHTLQEGESFDLTASVVTTDGSVVTLTWDSSEEDVATIEEKSERVATVKTLKAGETFITVSAGNKTATCKVTVMPLQNIELTLDHTEKTLLDGRSFDLKATVLPSESAVPVRWESGDETVATIAEKSGNVVTVTAHKVGKTTITARAGDKTAKCDITVESSYVDVTSVIVTPLSDRMEIGDARGLQVRVLPEDATNKEVRWISRDEAVATVNNQGRVVARAVGTVFVVAESKDNPEIKDSCEITVIDVPDIQIELVTLPTELRLEEGESVKVAFEVEPIDVEIFNVKWNSNLVEKTYLTITPDGPTSRTATIKVTDGLDFEGSDDNTLTTSFNVTVNASVGSMGVSSELCVVTIVKKEFVNFGDNKFESAVKALGVDKDNDGEISAKEARAVTDLDLSKSNVRNITSLKGIEYFTSLTTLNCRGNNMTELDLRENKLLKTLDCSNNKITKLQLADEQSLLSLNCSGNEIGSLELGAHVNLASLDCSGNKLENIDLSNKGALEYLDCSGNHISSLSFITPNVLKTLKCNNNSLSPGLDVSDCRMLEYLDCSHNDLSEELMLELNDKLTILNCSDNKLIDVLDLKYNVLLTEVDCSNNQLTSLDLGLDYNTLLTKVDCSYNQLTSLDLGHKESLTVLICSHNNIDDLKIDRLNGLEKLDCQENSLVELDLSGNVQLRELYCNKNEINGALNLMMMEFLEKLNCKENPQLLSIHVSQQVSDKIEMDDNEDFLFDEGVKVTTLPPDFIPEP